MNRRSNTVSLVIGFVLIVIGIIAGIQTIALML